MVTVITIDSLKKIYGAKAVVDGISFQVTEGEIFGIIGPNGAGKTTTVECVQGLRRPDGGDIRVLGLDPQTESRALRRQIGSQLQELALPRRIKVWEGPGPVRLVHPGGSGLAGPDAAVGSGGKG